ncbi:MAG: DJ-1/PfpI family protein [Chloroflexi bacterium]|nr:MAG: DJ-1/PfpI family protein [Chloroflexota bacterium]
MAGGKKVVALVIYQGVRPLSLVGIFNSLGSMEMKGYKMVIVGEQIEELRTDTPVKIIPEATFDAVPNPYGMFVMDGGAEALKAMENPALLSYIKNAGNLASIVGSVGTGSLILAKAGLLEGRSAATHWAFAEYLEALGARYVQKRWVEDGKFITAAGASASIDMGFSMVNNLAGPSFSHEMQLGIEYDPEPPMGCIPWQDLNLDQLAQLFRRRTIEMEV